MRLVLLGSARTTCRIEAAQKDESGPDTERPKISEISLWGKGFWGRDCHTPFVELGV